MISDTLSEATAEMRAELNKMPDIYPPRILSRRASWL
jgi:hypothetical protein